MQAFDTADAGNEAFVTQTRINALLAERQRLTGQTENINQDAGEFQSFSNMVLSGGITNNFGESEDRRATREAERLGEINEQVVSLTQDLERMNRVYAAQSALSDLASVNVDETIEAGFQRAQMLQNAYESVGTFADFIQDNLQNDFTLAEEATESLGASMERTTERTFNLLEAMRPLIDTLVEMKFQAGEIKLLREDEEGKAPFGEIAEEVAGFDLLEPFSGLQTGVESALSGTFNSIGQFITGTKDAFSTLGQSIKDMFGQTFATIGQTFLQGAISAAISPTGGPIAALLGLGAMFSVIGGLLSGGGTSMSSGSRGIAASADILQSIRPEVSGAGGATVSYHQHIGVQFTNRDESARAVRDLQRHADTMGEAA